MAFIHITIQRRLRQLSLALSFTLSALSIKAQTYLPPPATLTVAPVAGSYYSNTSITLNPTFSFTAASGSSLSFYIVSPDCVPQTTTLSANQNYILNSVPRVGGITDASGLVNRSTCELMQTVQYFDGLGRPLQTVQVKGSTGLKDVVQPVAYDAYGREATKYLPYASPSSDGSYKPNAISTELGNFYGSGTSGTQQGNGIVVNPNPFSITNFEPSPLNRVVEQGAPGADWQPVSGHTMKIVYTMNDQSSTFSSVPGNSNMGSRMAVLYNVTINPDQSRSLTANGTYQPAQLYVTVTKNENWNSNVDGCTNTTEEYVDKDGQVVLKRTYNFNTVTNKIEELSTYYVFDDLGNLVFVLPPGAGPDAGISSTTNQALLDNFCYQYRYDDRNRLIQKKIPGRGWEFVVYNTLNQATFTQDANQRAKANQEWTFTRYDALGRVVIMGIWLSGDAADNSISAPSLSRLTWLVDWSKNHTPLWASRDNSTATGYKNDDPPGQLLTVNYYDDYNIPGLSGTPYAIAPIGANSNTTGLPTATKTAILNSDGTISSNMLWSVNYYDDLGQVKQAYQQHYLGGIYNINNYDVISSSYSFTGQVNNSARRHYTVNSGGTAANLAVTITNRYDYDHMGRGINSYQRTGTDTSPEVQLSKNEYNEIGQLKTKTLGGTLQALSYTYNERGWMRTETTSGNLFNIELKYNQPDAGGTAQYNGNIAQMNYLTTKVTNPGSHTFRYSYDKLNRLSNAAFSGGSANDALNEQMTYDIMGNMTQMLRGGLQGGTLNYTSYTGNQLNTVTGYSSRNYLYDANGNAKSDGIGKDINYNQLDLPREVKQTGTLKATYTYDATGQKLRNTGSDGSWDYISGIVYNNNAISFIQTEEGRASRVPADGTYNYEYNIKDHLGNTRVSIDQFNNVARVIQEDEYYSFGLRKSTGRYDKSSANRYLYNGKELQTDLTDQLDYGARLYDPVIGRWSAIDPLAGSSDQMSAYDYVNNNPVNFIDPNGMSTTDWVRAGSFWVFNPGITSAAQAAALGYDEYAAPGTVLQNTSIDGGAGGSVLLGNNANDVRYLGVMGPEVNIVGHHEGVGQPGVLEGALPLWGSSRSAIDHFQNGQWVQGTFQAAMAVSDLLLVKSIATAGIKLGVGLLGKAGVEAGAEAATKASTNLWKVGAYEDIQGLERGLDAHHVGQKALMDKFVAGYELETAPAILVPKVGHTVKGTLGTIVARSTKGVNSARSLLARDIMELRRVYGGQGLPNSALEELIQLNKSMYPTSFIK